MAFIRNFSCFLLILLTVSVKSMEQELQVQEWQVVESKKNKKQLRNKQVFKSKPGNETIKSKSELENLSSKELTDERLEHMRKKMGVITNVQVRIETKVDTLSKKIDNCEAKIDACVSMLNILMTYLKKLPQNHSNTPVECDAVISEKTKGDQIAVMLQNMWNVLGDESEEW